MRLLDSTGRFPRPSPQRSAAGRFERNRRHGIRLQLRLLPFAVVPALAQILWLPWPFPQPAARAAGRGPRRVTALNPGEPTEIFLRHHACEGAIAYGGGRTNRVCGCCVWSSAFTRSDLTRARRVPDRLKAELQTNGRPPSPVAIHVIMPAICV